MTKEELIKQIEVVLNSQPKTADVKRLTGATSQSISNSRNRFKGTGKVYVNDLKTQIELVKELCKTA